MLIAYCVFPQGMVKRIVNAKIACLDFSLQKTKMKMGVQVIISDPEKLDQIRQRCVTQYLFHFSPFSYISQASSHFHLLRR